MTKVIYIWVLEIQGFEQKTPFKINFSRKYAKTMDCRQVWKNEFFNIFRHFSGKCSVGSENDRNFCQNQKFLPTSYFRHSMTSIIFKNNFWHISEPLEVVKKWIFLTFLKITLWFGLISKIFCIYFSTFFAKMLRWYWKWQKFLPKIEISCDSIFSQSIFVKKWKK